jgi:hypothetical protein
VPIVAAVAVNATEANPAGAVTEEGTVRLVLLLLSVTAKPPAGATALSVTVQAEDPGAFTVIGEQLNPLTVTAAFSVTVVVWL